MHIAIIGNGVSGITAARHIRKGSDHQITVISEEADYFFSRTALLYAYMGHLRPRDLRPYEDWFWEKNRIGLLRARVEAVDFDLKTLLLSGGKTLLYDKLILAAGSQPNKFGWPGQDLDGVHGLYHWQDLEAMERHSAGLERAVIVGGGLIGIEMAEMFHTRHIPVTFLVRETSFWNIVLPAEESAMINRHIAEHGIDLRLETELREIVSDDKGKCRAVITSTGETIECGFVGLTAGVHPNVAFLKNTALEINRGILVDAYLETNLSGVYAIGDCAELRQPPPGRRPIEAVWYAGRRMGETVAQTVCGQPTRYDPGIWFNSAKFFDIEYQVYGDVQVRLPEHCASVYWEHPDGKKSIRLVYERASGRVLGFNLMGIRYRQDVCEQWLRTATPVGQVLEQLGLANFDPEFFPQHEQELVGAYNRQTGNKILLKQKRGLPAVLRFLR
ncbi:MAG: NAD(P)/FAD-dependent oxidoreductase [Saprospirales bacterium]|jgi:NADPH-dependent 2,4-dienoyl-CoA reductase/sulfur reductase-like enzyme|nr:NAD(P)/FAD-dependent oxidoreductase [Saprospirales bacterium]MBK8921276.1 NAD(P)/FAD-dependent oxidoreductase [Saprospirales bacterium]